MAEEGEERAGVRGHEVVGWFDGWVVGEQTTSQPNHLTTQFPPHPNPLPPGERELKALTCSVWDIY